MTTKEMTAAEHAQTARDFLTASDREFAAGDHLQGSEKLYGAATQAVIAICQQRGWRYRSHRDMKNAVTNLAREQDDLTIVAGFATAERFHKNFFHDEMEDYEMEAERPAVQHFVERTLALLENLSDGRG